MRLAVRVLALIALVRASPIAENGGCFTPGWTTHRLLQSMESNIYHQSAEDICSCWLAPTITKKTTATRTDFARTTTIHHTVTQTRTTDVTTTVAPVAKKVTRSEVVATTTLTAGRTTSYIDRLATTTTMTTTVETTSTTKTDTETEVIGTQTAYTTTSTETEYSVGKRVSTKIHFKFES